MTQPIEPFEAAALAKNVYLLSDEPTLEVALLTLKQSYKGAFEFPDTVLTARSGGPGFLKCRTAFGLCLIGRKQFEGQSFLVFRGTKFLADWLTNVSAMLSRSSNNQPIHTGFSETFKSLRPQIMQLMPQLANTRIHCIGHSLGGAVASLCAEWIELAYQVKPCLYTFGAPRVGLHGFASIHTRMLGSENFYRVYRTSDVVPYLPCWPFIHAPVQGPTYRIPALGLVPMKRDHSMDQYSKCIGTKTWEVLNASHGSDQSDVAVERWLMSNRLISLTVDNLDWLGRAIMYVLERCVVGAARLLSLVGATQLTLLDTIAVMLERGLGLAETVSRWVGYLVRKILILLGRQDVVDSADITRIYLRHLLVELQQKVNTVVRAVLDQALVSGRAI